MDRQPDARDTDHNQNTDVSRQENVAEKDEATRPPIIKPGDHRSPQDPDLPLAEISKADAETILRRADLRVVHAMQLRAVNFRWGILVGVAGFEPTTP
ncbi:hypothetical protein P6U16_03360 [Rhizobium sp. 32-5/1]|uniref:hypothetical protein n=1 Tax=Rhizobium sp. 32-5/1 TaxID=3019602 RepID=UPI00240E5943|nr:hypothetical protein [Rhizobium sp. 32-5/1]WEZ83827.1 hypothetical protein P6U16_03360 [Rhizobium sp. 32-5/1]